MKDTSMTRMSPLRRRVVIVGAGFGGLSALRVLARAPVEVLLVDRNNYHTFLPLLYQVGAAELAPEDIVYPVRTILRSVPNASFVMAEVTRIDLAGRRVETNGPMVAYDYLILASGSTTHYYGTPGAPEYCFDLKTIQDGMSLRNHILCCFERAVHTTDGQARRKMLTFTIVGGGPTGVEFAGALAELIRGPLFKDFPGLDSDAIRVVLLEARDRLLPGLPARLGSYAERRLLKMGVEVQLEARVGRVSEGAVHFQTGSSMATQTVVWTAGVRGRVPEHTGPLAITRDGRIVVRPTLQLPSHSEVFAVGDLAYVGNGRNSIPLLAPAAIQEGHVAATNIIRLLGRRNPIDFQYKNRGTMVTIGRNTAVAHLANRTFTGFVAWILWLGVHLVKLIGFRNRILVLLNWAWDYLLYERALRLILSESITPTSRTELCSLSDSRTPSDGETIHTPSGSLEQRSLEQTVVAVPPSSTMNSM